MTKYLTVIEIVAIHKKMIEIYGGTIGIRDAGAIESACYRPQSGYYKNIIEKAAALMESLAINHPFLDGNKRVSFAATDIFLKMNGYKISGKAEYIFDEMDKMFSANKFEFKEIKILLDTIVI